MPAIPAYNQTTYDSVGYALNDARTHLGDRIATLQFITGKIRELTDPFMQQITNSGWRAMQSHLGMLGYQQTTADIVVSALPVVANPDPAVFCWLSWQGYFDGSALHDAPALPQDFKSPLKIWERWSGINAQFCDPPMEKYLDGLPTSVKRPWNGRWEWRQDAIWIPGSQNIEDLRIRYTRLLPDFVDSGTSRWYQQPVPIMYGAEALGWYIAAAVENAAENGDPDKAASYETKGQAAANNIYNRDVRADLRVNVRRRPSAGYGHQRW